jgi:hypothetical protein
VETIAGQLAAKLLNFRLIVGSGLDRDVIESTVLREKKEDNYAND